MAEHRQGIQDRDMNDCRGLPLTVTSALPAGTQPTA